MPRLPQKEAPIEAFDARLGVGQDAKQRIAATAVGLVRDEQVVILDAGTTAHHLAQAIDDVRGVTVYTPALPTAQHLMRVDGVEVHLPSKASSPTPSSSGPRASMETSTSSTTSPASWTPRGA